MNNKWTFRMIDTDVELRLFNFVVIQSRWWAGRHKSDNCLLRGRGEKLDWKHDTTLSWQQRDRRGGSFITDPWEGITFNLYQQRARETVGSVSDDLSCVRNDNGGGDDVACTRGSWPLWPPDPHHRVLRVLTPETLCTQTLQTRMSLSSQLSRIVTSPAPSRPHNWGHLDVSRYQDNSRLRCPQLPRPLTSLLAPAICDK